VSRPDKVRVDRFDIANASFWLDQLAGSLSEADNGDRFAADLRPGIVQTATPVRVIVGRAAAGARAKDPYGTSAMRVLRRVARSSERPGRTRAYQRIVVSTDS
jgi:hypothetical protein